LDRDEPRFRGSDAEPGSHDASAADTVTLLGLLSTLLAHRRRIAGAAVLVAVLVLGISLLLPREWTSSATFLPQTEGAQASQLSTIAAQFGLNIPGPGAGQSPQFYADLMRSEPLREAVVRTRYTVRTASDSVETGSIDLVQAYGVDEGDSAKDVLKAAERLEDDLWVTTRGETGVVEFSVQMHSPSLARQVAQRFIELVNQFNLETRQSQAAAEARFLSERVSAARGDLQSAEDSLQGFLERNRSYDQSPTLQFEYQRLQRHVTLQQQVYTSLVQSYEQARIARVRNTPVITVVEGPQEPAKPDRRHLLLKVLLGLLLGGLFGSMWAFWHDYLEGVRRQSPGDYQEFAGTWVAARNDLRDLRHWLAQKLPSRD